MSLATAADSTVPVEGQQDILLIGNPNVGKSALFKNLTNRYVTVSNYPGTTVDVVRAQSRYPEIPGQVIDTPGINDLSPRSEDARVASEIIESHPKSVIVQVADAKNLRRALFLTLKLSDLNRPQILVLNMADELAHIGGSIDTEKLSELLGVPVITTVAVRNEGTDEVVSAVTKAAPVKVQAQEGTSTDEFERNCSLLDEANQILAKTYKLTRPDSPSIGARLGYMATQPIRGLLLLLIVLLGLFWFVGMFGAGTLVDAMETGLFQQRINPLLINVANSVLPFPHTNEVETVELAVSIPLTPVHEIELFTSPRDCITSSYTLPQEPLTFFQQCCRFVYDFLVGEYGLFTMALSYGIAIVLPIVATFFVAFSLLEDSGYMPRLAIMVNRLFRLMGLNGKAVLPMILGLGCDTMATMTTRILDSKKERLVTTLLLALAVPCSAQLGVLLAMMARLSFTAAMVWVALMVSVMLVVGWLGSKAFPGESSDFILEIPPIRWPQFGNIIAKTFGRLEWYMKEVIPLFIIGTAILFLLDRFGALDWISTVGEPVVSGWLGLPIETSNAFLIGFMRRDFGAVYLLDAAMGPDPLLSPHQVLVSMVTITLFMPCIATFFMIAKEFGRKVAWAMVAFIFPFSFLVGGLVHRLGGFLGV
ncbi:MAG: ferrous iron transporter B [Planctomycetota bacterium]|jgi:ferrous iron transport protein B|nr:ferrous iron transporter B [Planctomycetota bacterium]MDP7253302.1 ferrous iron transporter B [Planctomycetota bacterium]